MFKNFIMLLFLVSIIIGCGEKAEKNENDRELQEIKNSELGETTNLIDFKQIQYEIPLRLKESKNNKFEVKQDKKIKLKLKIPLDEREIDPNNYVLRNISDSSENLNAILLILRPKEGGDSGYFTVSDKDISNLKFETDRLQDDQQLITFVYFDDGDSTTIENCFKKVVSNFTSYQMAREWFDDQYLKFECKVNPSIRITKPKENGGDVIGGS